MYSDDEEKIRAEIGDLIDDAPIEEVIFDLFQTNECLIIIKIFIKDSDGGSDTSNIGPKRKRSDDEDDELDDRLEDEDYDLIEENLGVKVERVSCLNLLVKFKLKYFFFTRNDSNVLKESQTMKTTRIMRRGTKA